MPSTPTHSCSLGEGVLDLREFTPRRPSPVRRPLACNGIADEAEFGKGGRRQNDFRRGSGASAEEHGTNLVDRPSRGWRHDDGGSELPFAHQTPSIIDDSVAPRDLNLLYRKIGAPPRGFRKRFSRPHGHRVVLRPDYELRKLAFAENLKPVLHRASAALGRPVARDGEEF